MKKKKIKKGIILLSMVMVVISAVMPVTSSAADVTYERGDVLYELENTSNNLIKENNGYTTEIEQYLLNNVEKLSQAGFYYVKVTNGNNVYYMTEYEEQNNFTKFYTSGTGTNYREMVVLHGSLMIELLGENSSSLETTGMKVTIYEIIDLTPTPSPTPTQAPTPSPTPDERVGNLLDETGSGIGTILTWIGNLWEGITTGDMSAILPIFAIFVIIPVILLVIKIIRKVVWGD